MPSKHLDFTKNFLINKPHAWFSEKNYIWYIIQLSKLLNISSNRNIQNHEVFFSKSFPDFKLHSVIAEDKKIVFQSAVRINRFMKGFHYAGERMWSRYQVDKLLGENIPSNIIDIGANIGEFSYYASNKFGNKVKITAIEPDPIALECIKVNLYDLDIKINEKALSDKSGRRKFYLKTESADSSFHYPNGSTLTYDVSVSTLDDVFEENNLSDSVLLKMDAEGHEPEVLLGGLKALRKIQWVTIDAGPERNRETTVRQVVEILSKSGFININVLPTNIVLAKKIN